MQTPFTPHFEKANIPLRQVDYEPFQPHYALPFIRPSCTTYWVGSSCRLIYRWHDAFDVFVAVIEGYFAHNTSDSFTLPASSHFSDLHLVYQLDGDTYFEPVEKTAATVELPEAHHFLAYTPPAEALLHFKPARKSRRFSMAVSVPKGAWVARHRNLKQPSNPLEELVSYLRQQHSAHRVLTPTPISPRIRIWLHLLLTTAPRRGLLMDSAVHHASAHLVEQHRTECLAISQVNKEIEMVEAARELVRNLVGQLDGSEPPTVDTIAAALETTPRRLRELHIAHYKQKILRYIITCRIDEAKRRLRNGTPIGAVVYQLGWADPPSFSKQFKKYTGLTPREFVAASQTRSL